MADRSLRGMRIGAQSLQSEEGVVYSERQARTYRMADGGVFQVVFAADAEIPERWTSPKSGQEGRLLDDRGELAHEDTRVVKPPRTHWDMLLERRSRAELEELLEERLQYLRARRGKGDADKKAS